MSRKKRQSAPLPYAECCEGHSNSFDNDVITIKKESPTTSTTIDSKKKISSCPSCCEEEEEEAIPYQEERWYHRLLTFIPKFSSFENENINEDDDEKKVNFVVRHRMAFIQFGAFATFIGAILLGRKFLKIPHQ